MIEETLFAAEEKMDKAVGVAREDFAGVRTERAIRDSDLGVNPSNDGSIIRVVFPELTRERRQALVKVVRTKAEDAKVSIRAIRRHGMDTLGKLGKDGEVGEDEVRRAEKELDETTSRYVAAIDEMLKTKESDLLEV